MDQYGKTRPREQVEGSRNTYATRLVSQAIAYVALCSPERTERASDVWFHCIQMFGVTRVKL
jgi:hypothetical protein